MTAEKSSETVNAEQEQQSEATAAAPAKGKDKGSRIARRGRKKKGSQENAATDDSEQANLGALNRHLATITQQLTAAHLAIGRVVAERDALRQHIADIQGVTLEEIPIPTVNEAEIAPQQNA